MSSTGTKQILITGLKSATGPEYSHHWSYEETMKAVKVQVDMAKEAGFEISDYLVDLEKTQDTTVDEFRQKLQSQHWDGVSIGFGVRGSEALTPLFERLVNAVVENVQPSPKLIFALSPAAVWEAISRVFGVEQSK